MATTLRQLTIEEPAEKTIARLATFVARMERRYECTSAFMADAVCCGHMKEIAEVAQWLSAYRNLGYLQELVGQETGANLPDQSPVLS